MRVILFRHGPAGSPDPSRWPDDVDRPLSRSGEDRTRMAAGGLARLAGEASLVLTSPLKRAVQTAEIAAEVMEGMPEVKTLDALAPGGSYRAILQALAEHGPEEVLVLVGHEPDLGKLAGTLLFGAPTSLPLKKAGACDVEFNGRVEAGAGQLRWFLPPKVLRRIGRKASRV
jgi:phosphohistidine phosphatase